MAGRRVLAGMLALASVVAACSGDGGDPDAARDPDAADDERECRTDGLGDERITAVAGSAAHEVASAVAATTHECAEVAVVAPADDVWAAAVAVPIALAAGGPLLLVAPDAEAAEVAADLDPGEIVAVGLAAGGGDDAVTAVDVAPADLADDDDGETPLPAETALGLAVADHLSADGVVVVPFDDHVARAAAPGHLDDGQALVPLPVDPEVQLEAIARLPDDVAVEVLASDHARAERLVERFTGADADRRVAMAEEPLWPEEPATTAWLVDPADGATAAAVAVAAGHRGHVVLPVDGDDLRSGRAHTDRLRAVAPERVVLAGDHPEGAEWQARTVLEGTPLPTGGFRLFEHDRMVAVYGHPGAPVLGALGAQDLDATVARVRDLAAPYGADGRQVVPSFEIITTVASSGPGPAGDYSVRTPIEELRPWVDRARDEGFYVVLDLQPGRTDFLTQAKEYADLLAEPHVGLALDPEWRLAPDQLHMRQIGSVGAGEVQAVADWLAAFTRERHLPEKLLVLHQFRLTMLPDRDTVVAPPELAVVVHMDGHGTQELKDGSYDAVTAGAEDRWHWGWKNFFDRDHPMASPERVLTLDPQPVFVSYQ